MPPDSRIDIEVAFVVPGELWIIPKINGHAWHWLRDDHFSFLFRQGLAILIPGLEAAAQRSTLNFPSINRPKGVAPDKCACYIRSTTHRGEPQVFLHIAIDPVKAFLGKRASGRADGFQCAEIELRRRVYPA